MQTGRYNSVSEVLREALRLMPERDQLKLIRRDEIRKKVSQGLASLRAGKRVNGDAVFRRLEAELDALDGIGSK